MLPRVEIMARPMPRGGGREGRREGKVRLDVIEGRDHGEADAWGRREGGREGGREG